MVGFHCVTLYVLALGGHEVCRRGIHERDEALVAAAHRTAVATAGGVMVNRAAVKIVELVRVEDVLQVV